MTVATGYAITLTYGCALRISEVIQVQVDDVDFENHRLRIRRGKGGHERVTWCPEPILVHLRGYIESTWPRPHTWLFYGATPDSPISRAGLSNAFNAARTVLALGDEITYHSLRHSTATHLHERGVPLTVVQDLLGHKSLDSTRVYARTTGPMFEQLTHPVETFRLG